MISCSNDTTIKVWKIDPYDDLMSVSTELKKKGKINIVRAFSTLDSHKDNVRGMDYSKKSGKLYSISDDGMVGLWDLHVEKLLSSYYDPNPGNHKSLNSQMVELSQIEDAVPICISCSQNGQLAIVGYNDSSLLMFD